MSATSCGGGRERVAAALEQQAREASETSTMRRWSLPTASCMRCGGDRARSADSGACASLLIPTSLSRPRSRRRPPRRISLHGLSSALSLSKRDPVGEANRFSGGRSSVADQHCRRTQLLDGLADGALIIEDPHCDPRSRESKRRLPNRGSPARPADISISGDPDLPRAPGSQPRSSATTIRSTSRRLNPDSSVERQSNKSAECQSRAVLLATPARDCPCYAWASELRAPVGALT